ncbi:MAG: lipocalin-like domain-containing protein [Acidobacteriota bacterium]
MKLKAILVAVFLLAAAAVNALAADPKLDGAYKYVSTTFPGGSQTEADAKGMIVVHGKYIAFVRAGVGRKTWSQEEPKEEREKKIIAAYNGLSATAGTFEIQGNIITLQQVAQAAPATMGTAVKYEYKLDGKTLTLKPVGNAGVEFKFERLP